MPLDMGFIGTNRARLGSLLTAWNALLPSPYTVKRAIKEATITRDRGDLAAKRAALFEVMSRIAGEPGGINARRLGKWLTAYAGEAVDGLRFEAVGTSENAVLWRVVEEN